MDHEKKWMLMTYYCPTHGDSAIAEQIEITKKDISEKFLKKGRILKDNYSINLNKVSKKDSKF